MERWILRRSKLARLEVSSEELARLEKNSVFLSSSRRSKSKYFCGTKSSHNVMREDENPHESGIYTEILLSAAPARKGNRIAVKQVISRKSTQSGASSGGK